MKAPGCLLRASRAPDAATANLRTTARACGRDEPLSPQGAVQVPVGPDCLVRPPGRLAAGQAWSAEASVRLKVPGGTVTPRHICGSRPTWWFAHDAAYLLRLLADSAITPRIYQRYSLADAAGAHRELGAGGVTGKIVLDDLAAELLASPAYQQASSAAARKKAAARFLIPRADRLSAPNANVPDELYARAQKFAKAARASASGLF